MICAATIFPTVRSMGTLRESTVIFISVSLPNRCQLQTDIIWSSFYTSRPSEKGFAFQAS